MAAETGLDVTVRGKDELSPTLAQLESKVIRWVGAISASLAAVRIGTAPIQAAANFERELANVAKTTNFLPSQIREVSKALLEMSTRTDVGALDLAKIAAAAGQQGLGKQGVEGVIKFTDSVARMASVLDVTAEDAATNIGKILSIFKQPVKDIEKAISTFNEVSNNSTASGTDLLDVVKRIGDATGALNLQQTTALAATGLDLGVSPEVVGSTFSTLFARLSEKAEDFGRLLKKPTTEWLELVKKDGVVALKELLSGIRKLEPVSQQATIAKLIGGGRQGALFNKLVQDTSNAVLDKNLASASQGAKGFSAKEEQGKVLDTLVAQSKAAMNSLFKLGADLADSSLKPLTQYVAQLNQALQAPGLKAFLQSIADSVLQMVTAVVDAVKFVAALNVNWENFIRVAKVFIGLKLASYFGSALSTGAGNFGDKLRYIATGQEAVAASTKAMGAAQATAAGQQAAADAQYKTSIASRILGTEDLSRKYQAQKAALAELAAAEKATAAARTAATAARTNVAASTGVDAAALNRVAAASGGVAQARAGVQRAQQAALAGEQAAQAALAKKLADISAADFAKRLAIQEDFEVKKAAITATGTRVGLTALKAEHAAAMAAQDAAFARSEAATQAYYARRQAQAVASGQALVATERAQMAQRLATFDSAVNRQAGTGAAAGAVVAGAAASEAALRKTTAAQTAAATSAAAAGKAVFNFGTLYTAAAGVIAFAGRLIASSLLWITILYSIADAFGLLDGLAEKFRKITDAVGLTSAADRQAAIDKAAKLKLMEEEKQKLDDLIAKYKEYTDASGKTTDFGNKQLQGNISVAKESDDPATRAAAFAAIEEYNRSLVESRKRAEEAILSAQTTSLEKQKQNIIKAQAEIDLLKLQNGRQELTFDNQGLPTQETIDHTEAIAALEKKIKDANTAISDLNVSTGTNQKLLDGLKGTTAEVAKQVAAMFTPDTLKFANDHLQAYADLGIQVDAAAKKLDEVTAAQKRGEASPETVLAAKNAWQLLSQQLDEAKKNINDYIDKEQGVKGATQTAINSWETLRSLIFGSAQALAGFLGIANAAPAAAVNGANVKATKPVAATGNTAFSPKEKKGASGESKERKEAKARLELTRATIQAENALKEEQSKQQLETDKIIFERGLKGFRDYYDARKRVQLEANQFDIDDKGRELAAVNDEIKNAKEKADKDKFGAQAARLQGQINVLNAQRKSIEQQNAEEQRKAEESFADRIRETTNSLAAEGIISRTETENFQGTLDEMLAQYRVFIAQLRTEGKDALADSLTKSFKVDALKRTLDPLNRDISLQMDNISRYQTRLGLAVTNGLLTSNQAAAAYNATLKEQAVPLQALLAKQEALLKSYEAMGDTSSRGYQETAAAIDGTRLRLEQLNAEQDKFAKDFNQSTTDSLSNILGSLELSKEGIKKGLTDFVLSIAKSMQQALGKSLSESIMQSLGQTGSGGLGGWLQGVLQGGRGGVPDTIKNAAGAKGITLGATPANALYVRSADAAGLLGKDALGIGGANPDASKLDDLIEKLAADDSPVGLGDTGIKGAFSEVSSELKTAVSSLADSFSDIFSNLGDTLSTLMSGIGDALSSSGGGSSGWISLIAGLFHNGGIAGTNSGMSRRVHPMLFAGAPRYHEGTMPGINGNEVPAILQKGEQVLTERQQADLARGAGGEGGGATKILNILDPELARSYMESAGGEKIIMNHIKANAGLVAQYANKG